MANWGYGNLTPQAAYAAYGTNPPYQAYSAWGSQAYHGCIGCSGGCYGCYGGWSCYGSPITLAPSTTTPARKTETPIVPPSEDLVPPKEKDDMKKDDMKKDDKKKDPLKIDPTGRIGNWATIVMVVPANAKVFIDGKQMASKATRRVYQTPLLEVGETYFYDIRVEVVQAGKTFSETRRVILNPGQRVAANFDELGKQPAALVQAEDEE